ncbi:exodeoxyribonuclease VII large subunit [Methylophilaceae bacterium]|nr:exodeoxyribonuclease VII large subunit [Methylophilaceae bacterium]
MNTPIINDFISDSPKIFSVSEVNRLVKKVLTDSFDSVWIKGEISNFTKASSGHWYFTIKDNTSQVRCTMFRGKNNFVNWEVKDGDLVEIHCDIGLYEARGEYQLNVNKIQKSGLGELFEAFQLLKTKLEKEGLFDEKNKKSIPESIKTIGVISSESGAVIKDIITTINRRNRCINIIIYPTQVQGPASIENIINAIQVANIRNEVDVLIIARGGGSIEDLWSFNDEKVVRAIASSNIATISAVGHETDFTIADFIADLRAPTPTAAAEMVSRELSLFIKNLTSFQQDLFQIMQNKFQDVYQQIDQYEKRLLSPQEKIKTQNILIDNLSKRIKTSMLRNLESYQNKVESLEQSLILLNPNEILSRGYAIAFNKNNKAITNVEDISLNDKIRIKLHHGLVNTSVTDKTNG